MHRLLLYSTALFALAGLSAQAAPGPLQQWRFGPADVTDAQVRAVVGPWTGTAQRPLRIEQGALVLDGRTYVDVADIGSADLPAKDLTVEAWVSVDQPARWGSIVGYYQDNGTYEKGWLLGYQNQQIAFQVSTGPRLVTVLSEKPYRRGEWIHVVGTYDGNIMRLYVDGELQGSSSEATGPIEYPPEAYFTLGAYRDQDERFPMTGKIREVRLYDHVLPMEQLATQAAKAPEPGPPELEFRVRPVVRFKTPDTATVTWESTHPGPGTVAYGPTRDLGTVVHSAAGDTLHEVTLQGLAPNTVYHYKLAAGAEGKRQISKAYSFDTAMNYTLPPVAAPQGNPGAVARFAAQIIRRTGVDKGYCLVIGSHRGELAYELARQSNLRVVGVDEDPERIARARQALYERGVYGSRVTLMPVDSYEELPITSCFANLIVSEELLRGESCPGTPEEMQRVLRPGGGAICLVQPRNPAAGTRDLAAWAQSGTVDFQIHRRDGQPVWAMASRAPVPAAGEWTHQYGTPGNTAASGESLGGATATTDLAVQWVGRPGADFGIDRNPRMPAPLSVNGRLFHQGMDRLMALDAYNGAVLWNLEIPDLRRLNLPRDCSNWCADPDRIFVAVRDRAWILDAGTGQRVRTLAAGTGEAAGYDWGFIANTEDRLVGSAVRPHTVFEQYWGATSWYDDNTAGPGTAKVCSDQLFAYDKSTGERAWTYTQGMIINSTLSVAGGRVYFVECRHPDALALPTRRINDPVLWQDQFLVALDVNTGAMAWEKPIDTVDGILTFYMAASEDTIVLTASEKRFYMYAFDPANGEARWDQVSDWPSADHSGHIQHPVLAGDRFYLEPRSFDLASGEQLPGRIGARSGCTTYIASSDALIYRGANRKISMWDPETGEVTGWTRLRPSCWLSVIAAGGLLQVPEGGAGCSCGGWMETSLAFAPRTLLGLDQQDPSGQGSL